MVRDEKTAHANTWSKTRPDNGQHDRSVWDIRAGGSAKISITATSDAVTQAYDPWQAERVLLPRSDSWSKKITSL